MENFDVLFKIIKFKLLKSFKEFTVLIKENGDTNLLHVVHQFDCIKTQKTNFLE